MERQQQKIRTFSLRMIEEAGAMTCCFDRREQVQRIATSLYMFFNEAASCSNNAARAQLAEKALGAVLELKKLLKDKSVELDSFLSTTRIYRNNTKKIMKFGLLKNGRIDLNK